VLFISLYCQKEETQNNFFCEIILGGVRLEGWPYHLRRNNEIISLCFFRNIHKTDPDNSHPVLF